MTFDFNLGAEQVVAIALAFIGAGVSTTIFMWRVFSVTKKFITNQETMTSTLSTINKELTTNGGSSVKDMILRLNGVCERIERRQKVIDQRSKVALEGMGCVFEIDRLGHLVWANEDFCRHTIGYGNISQGLDWIAILDEGKREEFVIELNSCLDMARKIDIETLSAEGNPIHIVGRPYHVGEGEHEGFIIQICKLEK